MKFSIITLGCKVNAYESQYYAGQLEELGYEQVSPDQACDMYCHKHSRQQITSKDSLCQTNESKCLMCCCGMFCAVRK